VFATGDIDLGNNEKANGLILPSKKTVYLNMKAENLENVNAHEIAHYMVGRNPRQYARYIEKVKKNLPKDEWNKVRKRYVDAYQEAYAGANFEALIEEEIACDILCGMNYLIEYEGVAQATREFREQTNVPEVPDVYQNYEDGILYYIDKKSGGGIRGPTGRKSGQDAEVRYSLNPKFAREYDAWDGKNPTKKFVIGTTSKALQSIGIKEKSIVWDSSKIIKIKSKHPAMTDGIIKQVPNIIENPVLVMQSLRKDSRIVMFGEVFDADGAPVLAVLELKPTDQKGLVMDLIKIASSYGKNTNPQKLIDDSKLLYIDPNKNRTNSWLTSTRLQLPVAVTNYGSIDTVSQSDTAVKASIRENGEKDTGVRFSIKRGMTEEQRYEELKDAKVIAARYDGKRLSREEIGQLERATRKEAKQYAKKLYEKFGLDKSYVSPAAEITFEFFKRGFRESAQKQGDRTRDYVSFGKMLACFDEVIENAVPIEIHGDKYEGTRRADPDLKQVYVLLSAFEDETGIVPVQFEIKEFEEKENRLYVAVTLHKIRDVVLTTENTQQRVPAVAVHISRTNIRGLMAQVNPRDGEFLKYIPDGFLNAEQKAAKQKALVQEAERIARYREDVRFSLKSFAQDGRRFVEIDQDQERFEGQDVSEYPRIAKDIIREKFVGKVVGIDNRL